MPDLSALDKQPDHIREAQAAAAPVDPKSKREYQFDFSWKDPAGKVWSGNFISVIPNIGQQIEIAKRVAKRSHGTGQATLPVEVQELIATIAYLSVALIKRPDWAADFDALHNIPLVYAVAGEATSHLDTFRGHSAP